MYIYVIFLCMTGIATQGISATVYESYLQAHNAYTQEDYPAAVALLSAMPATSFPVLYNLGWAQLKNGNSYEALKSFFKAYRITSGFECVRAYAMYEQIQKQRGMYQLQHTYKDRLLRYMMYISTWVLQFVSFLLLVMAVILSIFLRKWKLVYSCVLICAVIVTLCTYYRYQEKTEMVAFAKLDMVTIYTGPDEQYAVVAQVPQGTLFSIICAHDLWYCVAFDTQRGWVPVKNLDLMV